MTRRNIARLFATALLFALGGCESVQTKAAHEIANALPRALGPARHYDVQVDGGTFALVRGHAKRIHIVGQDVTVAPNTSLDTLDLDTEGVSFDPRTRRIIHVNQAVFTGTVGQEDLSHYVQTHHLGLPGLTVRLRDTDAVADVPIHIAGLHTIASVSGTVVPDADTPDHLDFIASAASVGSVPLPAHLVNLALNLVNPVFDLSKLQVPVTVTQAQIVHGQMTLRGTANLDGFSPRESREFFQP
jgi:hypothetical protein